MRIKVFLLAIFLFVGLASLVILFQTEKPATQPQVLGASSIIANDLVLDEVNKFRLQNGLGELQSDSQIKKLVDYRISDMVSNHYYSHKSPQHGTYADLIDEYIEGSSSSCENLQLQNNPDFQEAVEAWSDSTSHRNCLLNPKLTRASMVSTYYDEVINSEDETSATYLFVFIGSN